MRYLNMTLLLMLLLAATASQSPRDAVACDPQIEASMKVMTVARVLNNPAEDYVTVAFLESARFYRLMRSNPKFDTYLARLQEAEKRSKPLKVHLTEPHGDVIRHVE